MLACLLAGGCEQSHSPDGTDPGLAIQHQEVSSLTGQGNGGAPRTGGLLFNLSGFMTAAVRPNSSVFLFSLNNLSFNETLVAIRLNQPMNRASITSASTFSFANISAGSYAIATLATHFSRDQQGFPVINEFNHSGQVGRQMWHGGDSKFSVAVFSITPMS